MIRSIRFWAKKYAGQYAGDDVDRLHSAMRQAAARNASGVHKKPRTVLEASRVGRDWACTEKAVLSYLDKYHARSD